MKWLDSYGKGPFPFTPGQGIVLTTVTSHDKLGAKLASEKLLSSFSIP